MGVGIAHAFAAGGANVAIVEVDEERVKRALASVAHVFERSAQRGAMTPGAAAEAAARVSGKTSVETLPLGLDVIVEAVPEIPDLKRAVLARCAAREPHLLATNTSGLSIDTLAAELPAPGRFLVSISSIRCGRCASGNRPRRAHERCGARRGARALRATRKTSIIVRDARGLPQRAWGSRSASRRFGWWKTASRRRPISTGRWNSAIATDGAAQADRSRRPRRAARYRAQS